MFFLSIDIFSWLHVFSHIAYISSIMYNNNQWNSNGFSGGATMWNNATRNDA
jgi:hypothetical protein